MRSAIKRAIRNYDECQKNKVEIVASPGLLQPLPMPERVWDDISMDFVEGLSISHRYNVIWVLVDRFSKFVVFIPLKHLFLATQLTHVFLKEFV